MCATLGIDAGGSQTRWALVGTDQTVIAQGRLGGFGALQAGNESGQRKINDILAMNWHVWELQC